MKPHQEEIIITEYLNSIGPWSEYIVIGGGFALFIYKFYLADPKLTNFPIGTRDIDSLIPRKLPRKFEKNITEHLLEAGFVHTFKDIDTPPTEAYVKEISGTEVEIEFLTDAATRSDKTKNIMIGGVVAQPLSYLTLSLQTTMEFRIGTNQTGRVVSPGAWLFHKGLTFKRRKSSSKLIKDLYGIWFVSTQLAEFSVYALNEFENLAKMHSNWYKTFCKNLSSWLDKANPDEWTKLEYQDPNGKLKKLGFERTLEKILHLF
jgi:hypothetical protein